LVYLSLLIPTLPQRRESFNRLMKQLHDQICDEVEIISWNAVQPSIGGKRNALLTWARGKYVAMIDDDDRVSDNYISLLMEGIKKDVDCCSLKGEYSVDGKFDGIFEHSLRYKAWYTNTEDDAMIKYERTINHLNCVKSAIAKQFKFPEINFGEDHDWSKRLHESGLLKTEHYIDEVLYFYNYKSKKDY
jgi:glycosyltransferase involved in cell wall biosynthesis